MAKRRSSPKKDPSCLSPTASRRENLGVKDIMAAFKEALAAANSEPVDPYISNVDEELGRER